jgi:dTDP-4-dehydrorhamnose 3,5-epimerase
MPNSSGPEVIFNETPLAGAFVVDIEPRVDERGSFARTWCAREFARHGLTDRLVQASVSRNAKAGTIRGMHLQLPPSGEAKLIRCVRGSIHDVIVDLRPQSATFMQYFSIHLSAESQRALYIPPLMAHGFQTLEERTEVFYQMSDFYAPELSFGFRWNDPAFAIDWPRRNDLTILPRDADYPDFDLSSFRATLVQSSAVASPKSMAGGS